MDGENSAKLAQEIVSWVISNIIPIVLFIGIFFEISPIQFNPITWIVDIILKPIKSEMKNMMKDVSEKVDNVGTTLHTEMSDLKTEIEGVKSELQDQKEENVKNNISQIRWSIIEFEHGIDNGILYNRGVYLHYIDECRKYHTLIAKYNLSNGVIDDAEKKIKEHYEKNKDSGALYF